MREGRGGRRLLNEGRGGGRWLQRVGTGRARGEAAPGRGEIDGC